MGPNHSRSEGKKGTEVREVREPSQHVQESIKLCTEFIDWRQTFPRMPRLSSIPEPYKPGVLAHVCNLAFYRRKEDHVFKIILGYIARLRLAWAT